MDDRYARATILLRLLTAPFPSPRNLTELVQKVSLVQTGHRRRVIVPMPQGSHAASLFSQFSPQGHFLPRAGHSRKETDLRAITVSVSPHSEVSFPTFRAGCLHATGDAADALQTILLNAGGAQQSDAADSEWRRRSSQRGLKGRYEMPLSSGTRDGLGRRIRCGSVALVSLTHLARFHSDDLSVSRPYRASCEVGSEPSSLDVAASNPDHAAGALSRNSVTPGRTQSISNFPPARTVRDPSGRTRMTSDRTKGTQAFELRQLPLFSWTNVFQSTVRQYVHDTRLCRAKAQDGIYREALLFPFPSFVYFNVTCRSDPQVQSIRNWQRSEAGWGQSLGRKTIRRIHKRCEDDVFCQFATEAACVL
jgi:hypothetical protein